ncbi:MAG: calcium-binding protein, partial [Magnetococcales bacterium]|nr:calcium-binding protein [Magnetococcales bacterium]
LGRTLTDDEMQGLVNGFARDYLDAVKIQIENNIADQDVEQSVIKAFHMTVLSEFNLPPEAWTLYTPFQLMSEEQSDALWEDILSSSEDSLKMIETNAKLAGYMASQVVPDIGIGPYPDITPEMQERSTMASQWFGHIGLFEASSTYSIDNFGAWGPQAAMTGGIAMSRINPLLGSAVFMLGWMFNATSAEGGTGSVRFEDGQGGQYLGLDDGRYIFNLPDQGSATLAPDGSVLVNLFDDSGYLFLADGQNIQYDTTGEVVPASYAAQVGEALQAIADKFNTTVEELRQFNEELAFSDIVQSAMDIVVPPIENAASLLAQAMGGVQSSLRGMYDDLFGTPPAGDEGGDGGEGGDNPDSIPCGTPGGNDPVVMPGVPDIVGGLMRDAMRKPYDPLVLDLDGDGIELTDISVNPVYFDLDNDAFAERVGWVGADDGMLARDLNGDGVINDVTELFGNQTTSGMAALAVLNGNGDGVIDAGDGAFADLQIWRDVNQNGLTEAGELRTLEEEGIESIGLTATAVTQTVNGNQIVALGGFSRGDGTTGVMGDVRLMLDQVASRYVGAVELDIETLFLPKLRGYGQVADLHISMSQDAGLKELVKQFIALDVTHAEQFPALMDAILLRWAGTDQINPTSRGSYFDARKLTALERFYSQPYIQEGRTNPGPTTGAALTQAWGQFRNIYLPRLVIQGPAAALFPAATIDFFSDTMTLGATLADQVAALDSNAPTEAKAKLVYWHQQATILDWSVRLFGHTHQEVASAVNARLSPEDLALVGGDIFRSLLGGTEEADTLNAVSSGGTLFGFAGNDTLTGNGGADFLDGGADDDLLDGGAGLDNLDGGAGNDILGGALNGVDYNGLTVIAGVGRGNDYTGGIGNDLLRGTAYADHYLFNLGDGQDTLVENGAIGHEDQLRFGAGITAADLTLTRDGDNLVIGVGSGEDRITLSNWYVSEGNWVETLLFADGSRLDRTALIGQTSGMAGSSEA